MTTGDGKFYSNGLDLDWVGAHPDQLVPLARKAEAEAAQQRMADEMAALAIQKEEEERSLALLAEQKAARDARYAARKAAKKERRKG